MHVVVNGNATATTSSDSVISPTFSAHGTNVTTATAAPQTTSHPSSTSSNDEEDALPAGWKKYYTPDGNPYYYNENTKQSSWTKPAIPKSKVLYYINHFIWINNCSIFIQYMEYCNTSITYCVLLFTVIGRHQYLPVGEKKQMLLESHCMLIQRQMRKYAIKTVL